MTGVAARLLVAALAAACLVVAVAARRGDDRCAALVERAQRLTPASSGAQAGAIARIATQRCSATSQVVVVGLLLEGTGHQTEGLDVARRIVREEPGDYLAWFFLATVEGGDAAAKAALARARALNPSVGEPQRRRP
jgi:hypothetical protein